MRNKTAFFAIAALIFCNCRIEKMGKDLSNGVSQGAEAIGRNLTAGVQKGLSDSAFKQNLYGLVDSLTRSAGGNISRSATAILDSITSEKLVLFTRRLIEEATGEKLKANLGSLREELLGATTNERIRLLVTTAVSSALNEETTARLDGSATSW